MSDVRKVNYSSIKTLKRLLLLSKPYIPWFIILCLAASIRSTLGVLETEGFRRVINGATKTNLSLVKQGTIIGFIALGLRLIFDFFIDYYGEIINLKSIRDLQSKILYKLTKIKMINYEEYHSSNLIDRLDNCATSAQTGLNDNVRVMLEKTLIIVFCTAYLIFLNFRLMISSLGFILLFPLIINPLAKVLRRLYDKNQTLRAEKDSFVQDVFQGGEIVRSFQLTQRLSKSYMKKFNKFINIVKRILFFEGLMFNAHWIVIFGGDLFILGYGGFLVCKGVMDVGSVVSFLLMFERVMDPISALSDIWPQFLLSISSANKVFELLDLPEEGDTMLENSNISNFCLEEKNELKVNNVKFGYKEELEVLKGISFTCESGKVTALVGPSGGGKSTMLKMLIRLYEPYSGSILFGSNLLKHISPIEWRKSTAYVSQEPMLFSGTIYENIKYGNDSVTEEDIINAAKAANIHDTIIDTSEGYFSRIGEQGIRLSGGERQRIAIARAILRNPTILILDEPTSALDSENERLIQEALDKLMKGRTTIIVAHRLSTIQSADKIVYIEDGIVHEEGNHSELMKLNGKYKNIYEKIKDTSEIGVNLGISEGMAI